MACATGSPPPPLRSLRLTTGRRAPRALRDAERDGIHREIPRPRVAISFSPRRISLVNLSQKYTIFSREREKRAKNKVRDFRDCFFFFFLRNDLLMILTLSCKRFFFLFFRYLSCKSWTLMFDAIFLLVETLQNSVKKFARLCSTFHTKKVKLYFDIIFIS